MVQRKLRVGDLVDDYCPREKRISNHAVVALVGDQIKQTRCTTCDVEHDYKNARIPPIRKKKPVAAAPLPPASMPAPAEKPVAQAGETAAGDETQAPAQDLSNQAEPDPQLPIEGPAHRRLIRATLPKVEGQVPVRPIPEFTMHNPGRGPAGSHGRSFRTGTGAGPHRPSGGGKPGDSHSRPGGARHGQGSGGSFGPHGTRGAQGGQGGPHGRAHGSSFGNRPPRGKKP